MGTARRYRYRRRVRGATQRCHWQDMGVDFGLIDDPLFGFGGDLDAAEAYWREFGEELTDAWLARHARHSPGSRPWGFWKFTIGVEEPETIEGRCRELGRRGLLTDADRAALEAGWPPSGAVQ